MKWFPGGRYWDYHPGALSLSQVYNSFEDQAPTDSILGSPIFKWMQISEFDYMTE